MLGWKIFGAGIQSGLAGAICQDAATSISAAGTTQAGATELKAADNEITTVASGAGVGLSSQLATGDEQSAYNSGANALKVYPPIGMRILPLAANLPITLPVNTGCLFRCVSATRIFAVMSA